VRLQVLLAARGGCRDALASHLVDAAAAAKGVALIELPDDPFPAANPLCRPYEAVFEMEGTGADALVDAAAPVVAGLGDMVHFDLSAALVGEPRHIIPCPLSPLRYLYLMRRRAGTTHEAYLDYYFHHHSRFGHQTPGIVGYTQFHCDPSASAGAASALGLGVHAFDSVSELHFDGLDAFFEGVADGRLGKEAGEDEERFVDRPNSVSFCTATYTP
jgi:hypothetical protein